MRFLLGGEISNIYKRGGQTRKVHNVVFAPSFDAVERLQARLERIGNIRSDGRPILGLDSRDLLEIVLDTDPACHLIPAHIWTPWFSLLGSKSGFDSVAECFADLTPHIFALETGLSSDPPMNWRVSGLDRYTLVSNSDAHSPEKLGREANLFDCELAYGRAVRGAQVRGAPPLARATGEGSGVRATSAPSNSSRKKANTTSTAIAPATSFGTRPRRAPTRALRRLRQAGHRRCDASRRGAGRPARGRSTGADLSLPQPDPAAGGAGRGLGVGQLEAGAGEYCKLLAGWGRS